MGGSPGEPCLLRAMAETKYVAVGDADVAYRVVGDGPFDLLYFYGLGSHVDMLSDDPERSVPGCAGVVQPPDLLRPSRDRSIGRVWLETPCRPGRSGPTISERCSMPSDRTGPRSYAALDAGPIAMMFAALQPERVSALILTNTSPRYLEADDYPIGVPQAMADAVVETVGSLWGTEELANVTNPARADDAEFARSVRTETPGCRDAAQRGRAAPVHLGERRRSFGSAPHPGSDAGAPHESQPARPHRPRPIPGRSHPRGAVRRTARPRDLCSMMAELATASSRRSQSS